MAKCIKCNRYNQLNGYCLLTETKVDIKDNSPCDEFGVIKNIETHKIRVPADLFKMLEVELIKKGYYDLLKAKCDEKGNLISIQGLEIEVIKGI